MINTRVINTRTEVKELSDSVDKYGDKLIKYIPADIVAAYLAFRTTIIPDKVDVNPTLLPYGGIETESYFVAAFYLCLILTPFYKLFMLKHPNLKPPFFQAIISTIAFAVWVFAFGDYFEIKFPEWYSHEWAALVLIAFTLLVPLIEKIFLKPE